MPAAAPDAEEVSRKQPAQEINSPLGPPVKVTAPLLLQGLLPPPAASKPVLSAVTQRRLMVLEHFPRGPATPTPRIHNARWEDRRPLQRELRLLNFSVLPRHYVLPFGPPRRHLRRLLFAAGAAARTDAPEAAATAGARGEAAPALPAHILLPAFAAFPSKPPHCLRRKPGTWRRSSVRLRHLSGTA